MTKASKVLTILLVFFSVAFMGFAAVTSVARSNFKERAAEFPEKIEAQKKQIEALDPEIARFDVRLKDAQASIKLDLQAIKRRETALEAELKQLNTTTGELAGQIVTEAKKAQQKREEARLRREDAVRLSNELQIIRAQKAAALAEQQRLYDLLRQAEGTLERAERRMQLLEADGARVDGAPPAAKPSSKKTPDGGTVKTDAGKPEAAKPDAETPEKPDAAPAKEPAAAPQ